MSDVECTDALGFSFRKKTKDVKDSAPINPKPVGKGIDKYADYYDMSHYKRGKAIIFNHYAFDDGNLSTRVGTEEDAENVQQTFEELKFDVYRYNDLKYGAIYDEINKVAQEDHTDHDCLVVIVMSHGDTGKLNAKDHSYPPDILWTPFTGDKCPTLAGKPKLFFIQACRGDELDPGVKMTTGKDSSRENVYCLPVMADILIMYSTTNNHYSFRSPANGAWFIQALCKELQQRAREQDLLTILTFVNRTIAVDFSSNVPGNKSFDKKKQVGQILSSLTRLLYFYP